MTAADDVRREYVERHKAGEHSWQPGPLVKVFDKPDDIILVCACGEVTRRSIPARALLDERDGYKQHMEEAYALASARADRVAALEEGLRDVRRAIESEIHPALPRNEVADARLRSILPVVDRALIAAAPSERKLVSEANDE